MTFPGGRGSVRAAFSGSDGASPSDTFKKLASLMEYDGGLTREAAERAAGLPEISIGEPPAARMAEDC
jgi:hypothetical protein